MLHCWILPVFHLGQHGALSQVGLPLLDSGRVKETALSRSLLSNGDPNDIELFRQGRSRTRNMGTSLRSTRPSRHSVSQCWGSGQPPTLSSTSLMTGHRAKFNCELTTWGAASTPNKCVSSGGGHGVGYDWTKRYPWIVEAARKIRQVRARAKMMLSLLRARGTVIWNR